MDNEFTDFDEPMAETVIGWKGVTFAPVFTNGALDLSGEYSYIDLQHQLAGLGRPEPRHRPTPTIPDTELDAGVGTLPHRLRAVPGQEDATSR